LVTLSKKKDNAVPHQWQSPFDKYKEY